MLRRALLLALFGLGLPALSSAQTRDLARFRDSLQTIQDVPGLYRMERAYEMPGAARTVDPILERGYVGLRIYALTGDPEDGKRARDTFLKAAERFPADKRAHFGAALALADGPETRVNGPGGVLKNVTVLQSFDELRRKDPRSKARVELRRALEIDPAYGEAAVLLADLAVADGGRSKELIREARDVLKQAVSAGATSGSVSGALSRMETALGNYAEAAKASEAAAGEGDASALKARAEALLLQPGHEAEGGRLYKRAIELLTPEASANMFADVQVLLTPAEAAEWKRANLEQQADWLTRFWDRRAAESGVTVTERVAMHYRRLALAKTRYVRNSTRGSAGAGVLLADVPAGTYPFDQRGVMLVRHGAPVTVVTTQTKGVLPNETWVYNIPEQGAEMFHFVALRGSQDYSLVSDITKAINPGVVIDDRNQALLALLQDRIPYEQKYQNAAGRLRLLFARNMTLPLDGTEIRSLLENIDANYRSAARKALRTDTYRHEYEGDIEYLHDVFTFRSPFARTELTAAFALPARDLVPMRGSAGTRYAFRVSVILLDTLQGTVTRRDTTIEVDERRQLNRDEFVRLHVTLPVIPSEHTEYRLVAEDIGGGRGAIVEGHQSLRDYGSTTRLLVSDIVLAHPDSSGDWQRGNQRLALALPRAFEPTRPFTAFYEVYNFQPGESYSTRITVTPLDGKGIKGLLGGGKGKPIEVLFDGVASPDASGVLQEVRQIAPDLEPGRYRMVVEVSGKTSRRTATTETVFTVTN